VFNMSLESCTLINSIQVIMYILCDTQVHCNKELQQFILLVL